MKPQFIYDADGVPIYAVLPYKEYLLLIDKIAISREDIPKKVIEIVKVTNVSLLAAWRMYRGLTQQEVALQCFTTQSTVSQWEASRRPSRKTLSKLAKLYFCHPEQLI